MADSNSDFYYGFVDVRRDSKGQQTTPLGTQQSSINYGGVVNMRARLTAINPGYYTPKLLNTMTKNDQVYAVRQADDAAGIK